MKQGLATIGAVVLLASGLGAAQAAGTTTPAAANQPAASTAGAVRANSQAMKADDQADMQHMSIRQQISDQLTKEGYSDVSVMPSSFYIRAKDKQGNPVAMVVGPDSLTTVTEVTANQAPNGAGAASGTTKAPANKS